MLKIKLLAVLVMAVIAAPAMAGHGPCTLDRVTDGVCRDATNHVFYFDAPTATFAEVRDAIAGVQNYQDQVVCTQALIDLALCSAGQLDSVIANPISRTDFAEMWIKETIKKQVVTWKRAVEAQAAIDAVDTNVDIE